MARHSLYEGTTTNVPIPFEGMRCGAFVAPCYFYRVGPFRVPEAGEWYLSGAIPEAYKAKRRLGSPYRIVTPTHRAKSVTTWERGEAV